MKSLYNKYYAGRSEDAESLHQRLWEVCAKLFDEYLAKGYSPRELGGFFHSTVGGLTADRSMRLSTKMRLDERKGE